MVRLFGHYVSKTFILLGIVETLLLQATIPLGVWLRFPDVVPQSAEAPIFPLWPKALTYSLIIVLCLVAVGLYHRDNRITSSGIFLRIIIALALGSLAMSLVFYVFPSLFLGRGAFGYALALSLPLLMISRALFQRTTGRQVWHRHVLIVGTGENALEIHKLKKNGHSVASSWSASCTFRANTMRSHSS